MNCPHCKSINTTRRGVRNGSQRFSCNDCEKWYNDQYHEKRDIEPGMVLKVKWKDDLRVHGLTDIHVGASEFHREKFHDAIQQIKSDKNALWFGNGDLVELIPPNYKISQRGQYSEPDDQILEFLELVKPIKDKCLFIRGGNHDTIRSINLLGVDVCKLIAREMNVPYYRMPGYTQFNIKGTVWNMASGHGKSGAANGDLELNKLSQVYSESHVCFLGHNHQLYAKPVDSIRIVDGEESLRRRWYVRGGSFLRYANYARYSMYPIIRTGWVTTELTKDGIKCWEN